MPQLKLLANLAGDKLGKVLVALFILAILTLVFCAGGYLVQATSKPQVIIEHEIHTVYEVIERVEYEPVEKVVYEPVDKVIERIVYEPVEKVIVKRIEIPQPLRHFQDPAELEQWLGNIGVLDIRFDVVDKETDQHIKRFDCDDYALRLQEKALRDGYMMSFEVVRRVEYNDLFKHKQLLDSAIHAVNSAIIGNEVYYVEPQTHEVVFVAYLD